ncbi:MAG: PAS domain S-box protein [Leptolyngbya sp. SIO3F4]|nr:PAS domain S-box protein [Leptolyngbya sp. SIO3F4]
MVNSLKNLSLRSLLLIAFVGQLLGIVSLVGYLSLRNSQRTVQTLAVQIRQELTSRIERELRSYFEIPHEINRLNAAAFTRGELDIQNAQFGEAQLYQQMKISPNVALAYCGSSRQGEFFGVLRSPENGSLQLSYGNSSNGFLRDYFSLDVAGLRTFKVSQATKPYDARQRPWYWAAVSAQGPAWTDVYIAFTTGLPNVTASLPVYDRTGQRLLGVCATDVVLPEEFRNFLRSLEIGNNGQAFVLDRNGNLIANSNDEPLMVGEGDQARSLRVMESQDPLVRGTGTYLQNTFGDFARISSPQRRRFRLNNKYQFIDVVPFSDGFGLDWLIVVVVPEADFMGQIHANTRTTILLVLGGLVIAITLAVLAARTLTRPMLEVCKAAEGIAEGNLEQRVTPTPIREMRRLARTFNSMAQQLQSSFTALRKSETTNRAIVEAIPDLLIRTREDGTYLDIVGRDRLLQVHDDSHLATGAHVRDSLPPDLATKRLDMIQKTLATDTIQIYEQHLRVGEQDLDEEVRLVNLAEDEVLIMVRDITQSKCAERALRIAEEKYRSIYENALEGIFQSNQEGRFISVNPAMAQLYGYDSPADMVASIDNIAEQIYVDPEGRDTFTRLLDNTGEVKNFEYRSYRQDGSIIWVAENTRVVRDDNGDILYFEGIIKDVTDRKLREIALQRQLKELQIEIDETQKAQDVAQITESSYFQELQSEISKIDIDNFWT